MIEDEEGDKVELVDVPPPPAPAHHCANTHPKICKLHSTALAEYTSLTGRAT